MNGNTDINTYNIVGGLRGIGKAIGLTVVQGMEDGKDIQAFLRVNKELYSIYLDETFGWHACPALAKGYTLKMILDGDIPPV